MIKYTLLTVLIGYIQLFAGQVLDRDRIVQSGQYYYGTGVAYDAGEARDAALAELTVQIAVYVEKSFTSKIAENNTDLSDEVESILSTHSAATLKNVELITEPLPSGELSVFCYIRKDQVDKIFEERKKLIAGIVAKADQYAAETNCAAALKLYYFSLLLMNSLPDQNVVRAGVNYSVEVPNRINDLLQKIHLRFISAEVVSDDEKRVTLGVRCGGKPAALLDFTFWNGTNQISVGARDGLATLTLVGASVHFEELKTAVKYAYYECRNEYPAIARLWSAVLKPQFDSAMTVALEVAEGETARSEQTAAAANFSEAYNFNLDYDEQSAPAVAIMRETQTLLELLDRGDPEAVAAHYAADDTLADKLSRYLKFNHPRPLDRDIAADINRTKDGWELRRIRMLQDYPAIHRETTEYLVLDFSDTGKLMDLNLSISDFLYDKFVNSSAYSNDWDNRQQIIKFIERYRSAYQTRDIDTIDKMFSEDALIIKGRVLQRKTLPADLIDSSYKRIGDQPAWEQIRLTKDEFLKNEKAIFDSQQDMLVEFASFDIIQKNQTPNVYGIEMRQNYTVTTYQDEGYLFLLIDFNEQDPLIYVRAWQPNAWDDDELIRTANFKIYK